MAKSKHYQGLGYANYFYAAKTGVPDTISQQIEEWLKPRENFIAKELPRIINEILGNQHIKDDDRYILAVLMSMLWLRTPGMRNQLRRMEDDMTEQIKKLHNLKNINHFKNTDNIDHIKLMVKSMGFGGPGFANMFFGMKWKSYIARGKELFITSDSPVVEKWLPPSGPYGASFLERDKYFSLTPKILIELTHPKGGTKLKRKTLHEAQDDTVKTLNMILISGAQEFAYSENKISLEQLLAGRKTPGKLEKEYIEKYEKPWLEYHMETEK